MADFYYGMKRNAFEVPQSVQVGTVTNATDIEVHVNTTNAPTKEDVIKALDAIKFFILSNGIGTATSGGTDLPPK